MMHIMKITLTTLIFVFTMASSVSYADIDARILTYAEVVKIFDDDTRSDLGIEFDIYRAYNYSDNGGESYLVLTEKAYAEKNGHKLNKAIKAFHIKVSNGELKSDWEMKDFVTHDEEDSIWFWTKYISPRDYDDDGWVDPILIYGTSVGHRTDDGRVKIIIYYKGKKRAIRHQGSTFDFGRQTQVDEAFYGLPSPIQEHVRQLMATIEEKGHTIWSVGYQEAMNLKSTEIAPEDPGTNTSSEEDCP